jgi:hypothetical protein
MRQHPRTMADLSQGLSDDAASGWLQDSRQPEHPAGIFKEKMT